MDTQSNVESYTSVQVLVILKMYQTEVEEKNFNWTLHLILHTYRIFYEHSAKQLLTPNWWNNLSHCKQK